MYGRREWRKQVQIFLEKISISSFTISLFFFLYTHNIFTRCCCCRSGSLSNGKEVLSQSYRGFQLEKTSLHSVAKRENFKLKELVEKIIFFYEKKMLNNFWRYYVNLKEKKRVNLSFCEDRREEKKWKDSWLKEVTRKIKIGDIKKWIFEVS